MAQLGLELLCCLPSNDLAFTANPKTVSTEDMKPENTFFPILAGLQ